MSSTRFLRLFGVDLQSRRCLTRKFDLCRQLEVKLTHFDDGRSRSASPRVVEKDVAKKRVKLPDVKAPKKSEVEVGDGVTSSQSFPCFIFLYIYKMLRERFIVLPLECTHQELSFEWSHL